MLGSFLASDADQPKVGEHAWPCGDTLAANLRAEDHPHPVDAPAVARARDRLPDPVTTAGVTSVLTVIADPTRMRLLFALDAADELCVGDLAMALGVSEDAASYGLRMLRTAGLVRRRRAGRMAFYLSRGGTVFKNPTISRVAAVCTPAANMRRIRFQSPGSCRVQANSS